MDDRSTRVSRTHDVDDWLGLISALKNSFLAARRFGKRILTVIDPVAVEKAARQRFLGRSREFLRRHACPSRGKTKAMELERRP